jgi:hypothetical protein
MDGVCSEDGIGEFEEGIGSALKTLVERAAEAVESVVVRLHDALIMHSPTVCRLLYLTTWLKRKLRAIPRSTLAATGRGPAFRRLRHPHQRRGNLNGSREPPTNG